MNYSIAQVVVGLPIDGPFDYLIPNNLRGQVSVGQRVDVPFGRRRLVGFVTNLKASSRYKKLKAIHAVLDENTLLTKGDLEFYKRFAQYYGCPLGEAITTGLPRALRSTKPQEICELTNDRPATTPQVVLCHDKGYDKRWPFIIEAMKKVLADGGNVIFLVPEKYLLEKVHDILARQIDAKVIMLNKKMSPKQEVQQWCDLRKGDGRIVVGSRSTVFAPLAHLGLIVVYAESYYGYKEDQSPFYHVREVALMRSGITGCDVLFVDSTPSEEVWHAAKKGKIQKVTLEGQPSPEVKIVDLANYKRRRQILLSFPLQNSIQDVLSRGGKVLLFYNRRGFSTMIKCNQCGYSVRCPRCDVSLIYLYSQGKLVCPLCQHKQDLPNMCPACQKAYLRYMGLGIEKMESELARILPQARINRFDKETATLDKGADIIIATQSVFKVIDQNVWNIIGVLDIDNQLNHVDFRIGHRVFSLLVRLRQAAKEKLFIQSFHPDHYAFKAVSVGDFDKFYRQEFKFRKDCQLPPFYQMAAIGLRGPKKEAVFEQARAVYEQLSQMRIGKMEISDPQPDFVPKLRDKYRFIIMVKDKTLKKSLPLIKAAVAQVKKKAGIITTINVDP